MLQSTTPLDKKRLLDNFAQEARNYCLWATGEDGTEITIESALLRVSSLYAAAINLPQGNAFVALDIELPPGTVEKVRSRFSQLPQNVFWMVHNPISVRPEQPIEISIFSEVMDIFHSVAGGLILYDSGESDRARFEWEFYFFCHWGKSATNVLKGLHAYLVKKHPFGISINYQ